MALSDFFATATDEKSKQNKLTHQVASNKSLPKKVEETPKASMMTVTIKIEKPNIILVENLNTIDTRSLILNCDILMKIRLFDNKQSLNGTVKDMQMYTCLFDPAMREITRNTFLAPVTISLAGSNPEGKGLHIELFISDICICVSLYTIELLGIILNSLSPTGEVQENEVEGLKDFSDMWDMHHTTESRFWFMETEVAEEAVTLHKSASKCNLSALQIKRLDNEICIVNIPTIICTLEAGEGNKTIPMLILESRFEGKINDWSSQLSMDATLTLQMGYYNSLLAIWEPLIEPVGISDGNKTTTRPWELKLEVAMNEANIESNNDMTDITDTFATAQASMTVDISSSTNLELTLTKTSLDVLYSLNNSFSTAFQSKEIVQSIKTAPYKVINASGVEIELLLGDTQFMLLGQKQKNVVLETGAEVMLDIKDLKQKEAKNLVSILSNMDLPPTERYLNIFLPSMDKKLELPVMRGDTRYFRLQDKKNWGLVSSIKVDNGVTIVTISSILQVHNKFNTALDLYYMRNTGNELEFISTILPGSSIYVPINAVYSQTSELFFSLPDYTVTSIPFVWKDLQLNVAVTKNLVCNSNLKSDNPFVIRAVGEMTQVYFENTIKYTMASTTYNIYLKPAIILRNCLPYDINLCVQDILNEIIIKPGEKIEIPNVEPGKSYIVIRLANYLEKDWSCRRDIQPTPQEFSVWTFESYDSPNKVSLDLGMHVLEQNGSMTMSLYCPFWMINKTGMILCYRKSKKTEKNDSSGSPMKSNDENMNIMHHPPFFKGPILFSFNAKNFFGKKKACVRIDQGEWSEKFSIDVAGSAGVVVCKNNGKISQIGVSNRLTYNGLTKQITFTPFFVIINSSPLAIECQELDRPADPWLRIEPKSCAALWPSSDLDDKLIKLRIEGTSEITAPFLITESHTTLLKLKNKYGGVNVDIQLTEGATYVNLSLYDEGMAPAIIINNTKHTMNIWEKESVQIKKLLPYHHMYYTWDNPSAERILVWEGGYGKELQDELRMDGIGNYKINEETAVFWTSFLDGMQRILLFTTDQYIIGNVQSSKQFEKVDQEITVSIYGLGLSIVNNLKRQEVMYICIASTGTIWETAKLNSKRFKQMSTKDNLAMERAYQQYLLRDECDSNADSSVVIVDDKIEVDFTSMKMSRPHKRNIRRQFQTGLWFQQKSSPHQKQIHAKVNRLQIDNQLYDCTFPVMFAPVPPPKSIALTDAHKPFAELSIVQLLISNSQIKQFKYYKLLIQEFHIKVDLAFINAFIDIFDTGGTSEEEAKENFLKDCQRVEEPLFELVSTHSLKEQKSFYDLLHFSPLKIHVSFSMADNSSEGIGNLPAFLGVMLQGIGVTLTDLQDVVFKLAYFQREYSFLTHNQLYGEVNTHYLGQMVKQLYVLVLGLDVIGNPYGLVLGITKGVEDLFYEPFQGAIQGPGEFAEGLMLGVASLFGHTVGGAAGAVSRITGAMGKGIAALTFDKEYQRKRRDQVNKKATTVHEGLARGGKGLVMGVVDGVTGVFTKPISGAKEQGVGGFFKGLGKGAVGLVTRPTAGVMDFASSSFETVKRVTDMSHDVIRLRVPRFVQADCCVKPYNETLAYGNKLLCELEKGKYFGTDIYCQHFIIVEKKEVLLLSDKRMAYITHNELFGGWQIDWAYTWQEITKIPEIHPKGVQIFIEGKKKGVFHSSDNGKVIIMSDNTRAQKLIEEIKKLMHLNA